MSSNDSWMDRQRRGHVARRAQIAGAGLAVVGLGAAWVLDGGIAWAVAAIVLALLGSLAMAGAVDHAWRSSQRRRHVESLREHRQRRAQSARRRRRLLGVMKMRRSKSHAA